MLGLPRSACQSAASSATQKAWRSRSNQLPTPMPLATSPMRFRAALPSTSSEAKVGCSCTTSECRPSPLWFSRTRQSFALSHPRSQAACQVSPSRGRTASGVACGLWGRMTSTRRRLYRRGSTLPGNLGKAVSWGSDTKRWNATRTAGRPASPFHAQTAPRGWWRSRCPRQTAPPTRLSTTHLLATKRSVGRTATLRTSSWKWASWMTTSRRRATRTSSC
mmetsp:Transcript_23046/g.64013  ORF Transcript_23046/g.64013 Transcript_23046/m.64013 type:complete len:220 (-) Transcript_23046:1232-1891(-)